MRPFLFTLTFGALTTLALGAHADDAVDTQHEDLPVVIAYVAPSECASNEAFRALVSAQVARTPNPARPWRFSVTIRHDGDYVGSLKTETGSRELRAPTCDDVTAALSLVIAMAEPDLPLPKPTPPPRVPQTLPPPPPRPPPPPIAFARSASPPNDAATRKNESNVDWQFGVTVSNWQDGSQLSATGALGTVSAELPWGFPKMLFEVGAGVLFSRGLFSQQISAGVMPVAEPAQPWLVVDAEACPIDLPLGSKTGLSVLGCARMVVGAVNGIAGWGGGGGRLRWQSPWHVFVESHFNGMYGTRLEGIPALMDFGGSVGFRL